MMIRKRLAALEARTVGYGLSLAVRAWLGHELSPEEHAIAEREAMVPVTPDWSRILEEGPVWLLAQTASAG